MIDIVTCKMCGHHEKAHDYIVLAQEKSDQEKDPEILENALEEVEGTDLIQGYKKSLADCPGFEFQDE